MNHLFLYVKSFMNQLSLFEDKYKKYKDKYILLVEIILIITNDPIHLSRFLENISKDKQ